MQGYAIDLCKRCPHDGLKGSFKGGWRKHMSQTTSK
jgi:hypothetical protein